MKKLVIKLSIALCLLVMTGLSSGFSSAAYALDTTAPAPITTNEPVYTSPTLKCGQTDSNGQPQTAAQCAQQVKSDSSGHGAILIVAVVVVLIIVGVVIGIMFTRKNKQPTAPVVQQRPVVPNPAAPVSVANQQPPVEAAAPQPPQQPQVPQTGVDPSQNNVPPAVPSA